MDLKKFYDAVLAAEAVVNQVANRINTLFDEGKIVDAQALQPELAKAKAEAKAANALYLEMMDANGSSEPNRRFVPASQPQQETAQVRDMRSSNEYMQQWMNAFRRGVTPKNVGDLGGGERYGLLINALTETGGTPAGEEGGFLNPVDFDNIIIELSRKYVDLAGSVDVQTVTTLTGWRVIEQFAAALPLTKSSNEMEERTVEGESPLFNKIDYSLDEYRDFLPISNTFMQDTPVNIMNYLAGWFSKKLVLTNNSLVLALINAITGTAVADAKTTLTAIKTALNKTLDPAFSASASLFTNQSGLDVLDSLVDGTGRPMLQPDPSNATKFLVKGRPVVFLSDAHWANMTGPSRARIAIGDGRSYVSLFRRSGFEFSSTNVGGKAWRSNSTEVRGIARMDCQEIDTGAMTVLKIAL